MNFRRGELSKPCPKQETRAKALWTWIKENLFRNTPKTSKPTSATHSTFHPFMRLPPELRWEIWWFAATNMPRRTIQLEPHLDHEYDPVQNNFEKNFWALARSCSEAYKELTLLGHQRSIGADDNEESKFQKYGFYYRVRRRPVLFRYNFDILDIGSFSPDNSPWARNSTTHALRTYQLASQWWSDDKEKSVPLVLQSARRVKHASVDVDCDNVYSSGWASFTVSPILFPNLASLTFWSGYVSQRFHDQDVVWLKYQLKRFKRGNPSWNPPRLLYKTRPKHGVDLSRVETGQYLEIPFEIE